MALLEISEATMKRLREVAKRRRQSVEAVIEDLVARHLQQDAEAGSDLTVVKDAWFELVGLGSSGYEDTASRIRDVMDELTYPHHTWSLKDGNEGAR
jgi:hypothetical protein